MLLARIQYEMIQNGIRTEEQFVGMMRKLGGYSELIKENIGPEPDQKRNEIGMPTTPEGLIWLFKDQVAGVIREKIQGAMHEQFVKSRKG